MKNNKFKLVSLLGTLVCVSTILSGCVRLDVLSKQCASTIVKTDGKDDYAYKCIIQARNKGSAGKVRAITELHTAEGQFYREQVVHMQSEEVKTFEFIFTEPTVAGTMLDDKEVQYRFRYESAN